MSVRFIAGAVCPKCGAMDTLKAGYQDEGRVMVRECVDCGHTDRISQGVNAPREVVTRVTPKPSTPEVATTPVKILDPNARTEDS
ncbi:MAG: YheV family putative zinc ribbon protein [Saccharospirillum sp.]